MYMGITDVTMGSMESVRVSMPEMPKPSTQSVRQAEPPVKVKDREQILSEDQAAAYDVQPGGKQGVQRPESDEEQMSGKQVLGKPKTDRSDRNERIRAAAKQASGEQESYYDKIMAEKAMEHARDRLRALGHDAKFGYNDDIERYTITITDSQEKEVIKEIPSEEIQKMIEHLHTMRGMLMDTGV